MVFSIAIACGLMTLISTILTLATCMTSSQARRTTLFPQVPTLSIRPQESGFTMADAAA